MRIVGAMAAVDHRHLAIPVARLQDAVDQLAPAPAGAADAHPAAQDQIHGLGRIAVGLDQGAGGMMLDATTLQRHRERRRR
jgi:hypothetical protein